MFKHSLPPEFNNGVKGLLCIFLTS
jgi:hypothetical protein